MRYLMPTLATSSCSVDDSSFWVITHKGHSYVDRLGITLRFAALTRRITGSATATTWCGLHTATAKSRSVVASRRGATVMARLVQQLLDGSVGTLHTALIRRLSVCISLALAAGVAIKVARSPMASSQAASRLHTAPRALPPSPASGRGVTQNGITTPPGIPAIAPTLPTSASTATFTADDVRTFVGAHRFFPSTDGTTPTITKILFIPASEASALLGNEWIGRPANAIVCYVELHGNLDRSRIVSAPAPYPGLATPSHSGHLVFDARTGNLLIRGLGD
jgi:hypothetical protein